MKTCHICLEDVDSIPEEIIKECCDAFICNECWIKLKDNPETIQCPICKSSIYSIPQISHTISQRSFCDNYYKCIKNICRFLLWFIIGYLVVVIGLLVAHSDNISLFWKDIGYISTLFHFWILVGCFGYIIVHSIKSCSRCLCKYC